MEIQFSLNRVTVQPETSAMLPAFLIVLLLGATAHGTQQGKGTKLLLDAFYVFSLSLTAMMSNTVQLLNLGS